MKVKTIVIAFLVFCLTKTVSSQDLVLIDSLHRELVLATSDSSKAFLHSELCYNWCGAQFDSAWNHAELAHSFALKSKRPEMIRLGIQAKGWVHDWAYHFDSAIYYYDMAYHYSADHDDGKGMASSLFNIGVTHYYQGKLDSAIHYYLEAQPHYELTRDSTNLARLYNNLGLIYKKTGNLELALDVSHKSMKIKEAQKNSKGMLNSYTNMSSIFQRLDQYDSALFYSKKCIQLAKKIGDQSAYKAELVNAGIAYKNMGQQDSSFAAYSEAESLIIEKEDPYFLLQVYLNLGEYYFTNKQWGQTRVYLHKMKQHLLGEDHLETTMHYYQLEYNYHKATAQYSESLVSLEKFMELNQKYLDKQILEKTTEFEQLYEKEKRENEIKSLNLANENQKAQIAVRNNQRNIFISATIVVLLIAGFLFYQFREKAKISSILEEKNQKISETLEERETLLKEIHHRVKNNLQVISSLLNLQAGSLDDEAAIDAVREGQNRVKSMALIHQRLYSADDVRGVNVQEYLENLTKELFSAFGVDHENVESRIETNNIKMDIDTIIPLGLIINELITNSLKYAFGKNLKGLLEIQLQEKEDKLLVEVRDNGKGMDEEAIKNSNSFGWKMINSLGRKLKAEINVINQEGTLVQLSLSRYKLVV